MKYLGIDYGSKRIGLAVSDAGGMLAFPHSVIENDAEALGTISGLAEKNGVRRIVVGDTKTIGGAENSVTAASDAFASALSQKTGLEIARAPEFSSSIEVSRFAPEGEGHNDAAAAAFILQRYLDMHAGDVE